MKFVLILMLVSGWDENTAAITKVEGFTTRAACEAQGNVFENTGVSAAYKTKSVCLEVK